MDFGPVDHFGPVDPEVRRPLREVRRSLREVRTLLKRDFGGSKNKNCKYLLNDAE